LRWRRRAHRHHPQESPREQAAEAAKVKRFESGVVKEPITVSPIMTVRELFEDHPQAPHLRAAVLEASASSHRSPPRPALRGDSTSR